MRKLLGEKIKSLRNGASVPLAVRQAFAEFLGTYVLVVIGNASIAQAKLTKGEKGDFFGINWGWALGCMLGMLVSSNVSGGHLNPAVTLALSISRSFEWKKLPLYWFAQYTGALAASGTVLGIYYEAILTSRVNGEFRIHKNAADPGSAAIFANYPASYLSVGIGLADEILATLIFMLVICAVTNESYTKIPKHLQPLYVGFALLAIGIGYGANNGYALNPARDLAPRLVTYLGWWGPGVFSFRGYNWFWIFIVGPHVGAILGVGLFQLLLKSHSAIKSNELDLHAERKESFHFRPCYHDHRSDISATQDQKIKPIAKDGIPDSVINL